MLWEEEPHKRKALKYLEVVQECKDKGLQVWLLPAEIGCRGFGLAGQISKASWRKGRNKQLTGCRRRQRKPFAGYGIGKRKEVGSLEQMGSEHQEFTPLLAQQLENVMVKG